MAAPEAEVQALQVQDLAQLQNEIKANLANLVRLSQQKQKAGQWLSFHVLPDIHEALESVPSSKKKTPASKQTIQSY